MPTEQLLPLIDDLSSIIQANQNTSLADKMEDALSSVQTVLTELSKTPPDNQAAVRAVGRSPLRAPARLAVGTRPVRAMVAQHHFPATSPGQNPVGIC